MPSTLRSIRVRLAVIIVLAMTALVAFLVYQAIEEREEEIERADANLARLAVFAARGQREQFDATENLLRIAEPAEIFREIAGSPDDAELHESCSASLELADRLAPGARFTLWDTDGSLLCSSRAAPRSAQSATDKLWFQTAQRTDTFSTGSFELTPEENLPALSFAIPIRAGANSEGPTIAYLSAAITIPAGETLLEGTSLPSGGRLHVLDQNGEVINSTQLEPGDRVSWFPDGAFSGLADYLSSDTASGEGRRAAATRITDGDDTLVAVVISGESDVLVGTLWGSMWDQLVPVLVLTLLTLVAVWLLGNQWVVTPIEGLVTASQRIAAGDMTARAPAQSGVTEFERLAASFNEMAETREQTMRAKDDFLGLVSHELKTPITTALGNAEVLHRRGELLTEEQRREALADIHESTVRLTAIIDNLLVLARLERGVALDSEPVMLLRLAESVADDVMRLTPSARVGVEGDASVMALAGETYVEQVVRNLIENAVKYSPAGERVDVRVESGAGMAIVRVVDRGPGIEAEEAERVFEPFYRSERTASAAAGIGIGLSVCRRLVDAMGGSIWCKGGEQGGCEFGFTLPAVPDEEEGKLGVKAPAMDARADEALTAADA